MDEIYWRQYTITIDDVRELIAQASKSPPQWQSYPIPRKFESYVKDNYLIDPYNIRNEGTVELLIENACTEYANSRETERWRVCTPVFANLNKYIADQGL